MPSTIKITRKDLYNLVWSEPMRHLAKRHGISDVGMAKICRKNNIPCPPRGYWAKKAFGKRPYKIPLPNPDNNCDIEMRDPSKCQISSPALGQEVEKEIAGLKLIETPIKVSDNLHGSHALVSQANHELQKADTDDKDLIVVPNGMALDIRVSKASLRRSLLIMDALLKALEQRGYQVSPGPKINILGANVSFKIVEQLEAKKEQTEEPDLDGYYSFGHSRFNKRWIPTGNLVLHINDADVYWASGCRKTWRDGSKKPLEDRLNSFVAGLVACAGLIKNHELEVERQREERHKEELRRQEEARVRAEKRALFKAEQSRVESLLKQATNWRQSRDLRDYIETKKQQYEAEHSTIDPDCEFAQWLNWAVQQADRLDPLAESPPSILDENIPDEEEPKKNIYGSWYNR